MKDAIHKHRRHQHSFKVISLTLLFLIGLFSCSRISDHHPGTANMESKIFKDMPLRFIENIGQTLPEVIYHVEGAGHTVLFESTRVVFRRASRDATSPANSQVILEFIGSDLTTNIHGLEKQSGVTNYYTGSNSSDWHTHIPSFGGVAYESLYPGIDMVYLGDQGTFKNEYHVAEGADPGLIQFSYKGARKLKVTT